jgi:hypothetical protein
MGAQHLLAIPGVTKDRGRLSARSTFSDAVKDGSLAAALFAALET